MLLNFKFSRYFFLSFSSKSRFFRADFLSILRGEREGEREIRIKQFGAWVNGVTIKWRDVQRYANNKRGVKGKKKKKKEIQMEFSGHVTGYEDLIGF